MHKGIIQAGVGPGRRQALGTLPRFGRILLPLAIALTLTGCEDENGEIGLFTVATASSSEVRGLDEYGYEDFSLPQQVLYWETRMNTRLSAGATVTLNYEVLFFYAQERFEDQIALGLQPLSEVVSNIGFGNKCVPDYCPVYIVGLGNNNDIFTITTKQELANFFGSIDTQAELVYWLWTEDYSPLSVNQVDSGWEVTAERVVSCQSRQQFELFVDNNGVTTVTQAGAVEADDSCSAGTSFNDTRFNNAALDRPILGGSTSFNTIAADSPLNDPFQGSSTFNSGFSQPQFSTGTPGTTFINDSPLSQPTFGQPNFGQPTISNGSTLNGSNLSGSTPSGFNPSGSSFSQPSFSVPTFTSSGF